MFADGIVCINTVTADDDFRIVAGLYRNAQSHVLNQKAAASYHAERMGKRYEDCDFIVCHIDGGITVNAHR